jgi:uncharacterized protein
MGIAIVTGASSGIGKEFAIQMSERFELDEIWIIARRKNNLKDLGKMIGETKVTAIVADLTNQDHIDKIVEKLKKEKPVVHALVNNAGIGIFKRFDKQNLEDHKKTIDLNITALTEMTYLTLPYMGRGSAIVQVSSILAYMPYPGYATYAASKSYVLSFSDALSIELKENGVHVMTLCPGPTKTEFFENGNSPNNAMEPSVLVKKALKDLMKKKHVSFPSKKWAGSTLLARFLPRKITHNILKKKAGDSIKSA